MQLALHVRKKIKLSEAPHKRDTKITVEFKIFDSNCGRNT